MSLGGVIGGLFNALLAPLIFNSLAEYQVAMVVAALLLPPLTTDKSSQLNLIVDLSLTGVFLVCGVTLILMRIHAPHGGLPPGCPSVLQARRLPDAVCWAGHGAAGRAVDDLA